VSIPGTPLDEARPDSKNRLETSSKEVEVSVITPVSILPDLLIYCCCLSSLALKYYDAYGYCMPSSCHNAIINHRSIGTTWQKGDSPQSKKLAYKIRECNDIFADCPRAKNFDKEHTKEHSLVEQFDSKK
jgi:hypothetical protein